MDDLTGLAEILGRLPRRRVRFDEATPESYQRLYDAKDALAAEVERLCKELEDMKGIAAVNHGLYKAAHDEAEELRQRAGQAEAERDALKATTERVRVVWSEWWRRLGGAFPPAMVQEIDAALSPAGGSKEKEDPNTWCKCDSCWGWFVEEHPGEDLDELGRDRSWWSGLPEHRDPPKQVTDIDLPERAEAARDPDAVLAALDHPTEETPDAR